MKLNIRDLGSFFLPVVISLSACSDSKMRLETSHSSSGIAPDEATQENGRAALSEQELQLSQDKLYTRVDVINIEGAHSFNLQEWPMKCNLMAEKSPAECRDQKETVGLRDILVSGQVLVIDANQYPWANINDQRNVRSLKIEADKIVVRNSLKIPSAQLQLVAELIVFEEGAVLDVTPANTGNKQAVFGQNMKQQELKTKDGVLIPYDGADGLAGSSISVKAFQVQFMGNLANPRLIARGGMGEYAGQGRGQSEADYAKSPLHAEVRTPVGDNSKMFPQYANSIIFSAEHIESGRRERSRGEGSDIWTAKYAKKIGDPRWPLDGANAVAGGYPGAGGKGGSVSIYAKNSGDIPASVVDVGSGVNGQPDILRKGIKGGLPNPAYKINWSGGKSSVDFVVLDKPRLEMNIQKDGADGQGPLVPKHQNPAGNVLVQDRPDVAENLYSKVYFDLKVKRIKDLYIARNFAEAIDLTNFTTKKAAGIKQDFSSYAIPFVQLEQMKTSLVNQKDYFGHGLNDVSGYTFNFRANIFEEEVKRAVRAYYLTRKFEKYSKDKNIQFVAVRDSLKMIEENVEQVGQQIHGSLVSLSSIDNEIEQIKKSEKSIQEELAVIEQQIKALANDRVSARKNKAEFLRFVDIAVAVCQVIPVGQPALAAGTQIAGSSLKGVSTNNLGEYIQHVQSMKGAIDDYNKIDLTKSRESWKAFKDQFNVSNLDNKNFEEKAKYMYGVYEKLAPTIQEVSKVIEPLSQPVFPQDEIQREIEKIQTSDPVFGPIFQGIRGKLTSIINRKANLQIQILTLVTSLEKISAEINNYIVMSSRISADSLKSGAMDDGELVSVIGSISFSAEADLIRMYSDLVRAYQYTTLDSDSLSTFDLNKLRSKVESVLENEPPEKAVETLRDFYLLSVESLKERLSDKIISGDSVISTRDGEEALVKLSKSDVITLNKNGFVDLNLESAVYSGRDNVRIVSVGVDERSAKFTVQKNAEDKNAPVLSLYFELGTEGKFKVGNQVHSYQYPVLRSGANFSWQYTFTFPQSTEYPVIKWNKPSEYFQGLVASVGGEKNSQDLKTMYETHAGITKVRVRYENGAAIRRVKDLTLKIAYIYSDSRK